MRFHALADLYVMLSRHVAESADQIAIEYGVQKHLATPNVTAGIVIEKGDGPFRRLAQSGKVHLLVIPN
jgi:hypothetical protein